MIPEITMSSSLRGWNVFNGELQEQFKVWKALFSRDRLKFSLDFYPREGWEMAYLDLWKLILVEVLMGQCFLTCCTKIGQDAVGECPS